MAEVNFSKEQYRALLEMRWTLFWRGMRGVDNKVTLIAKIIGRLVVLGLGLGAAAGAGFAVYFGLVSEDHRPLRMTFWLTFMGWQFFVLLRSSLGHNVGRELLRFPISLRTYVTLWTLSGLTDFATMVGALVCAGMAIGAEFARIPLFFALGVPAVFFVLNMAVSRALFLWLERLLAHRRTREFVLILISMLGILPQAFRMYGGHQHLRLPWWVHRMMGWLPPSFAAHAMVPDASMAARWSSLGVLLFFCAALIALIGYRLVREYRGEDLHESVAGKAPVEPQRQVVHSGERVAVADGGRTNVALAVFQNEYAKLLHSGMAAYQMLAPLLFVVIFGVRLARTMPQYLLPAGMMYLSLDLLRSYNSFGTDGPGFQIFRLAPVRLRDVYLGKNLFSASIFSMQVLVLIAITVYEGGLSLASLVFAIAFAVMALGIHLTLANAASLRGAFRMDNLTAGLRTARMGGRRGAGTGGWRGLVAMLSIPAVAALFVFASVWFKQAWIAPAAMMLCAVTAAYWYRTRLEHADEFNTENMERALAALSKTA